MIRKFLLVIAAIAISILTSSCVTLPENALKPGENAIKLRQIQTRRFEGIEEPKLLSASAGVIQDLGFNIEESETKLGVITASKQRSAVEAWQVGMAFLAAMGGGTASIDKTQKLRVSVVARPRDKTSKKDFLVRVTFQRMVWNTQNQVTRAEPLNKPEMYQEFFDKLSKAVFLEAQEI